MKKVVYSEMPIVYLLFDMNEFELEFEKRIKKLDENLYVLLSSTNIGIILDEAKELFEVYLVDSGNTEIDGENILDALNYLFSKKNKKYIIKAILNTHSHADHSGGNSVIQKNSDCQIWSPLLERGSLENPVLQGSIIWGGYPPHQLRTVFYQTEPQQIYKIFSEDDCVYLSNGANITFINLPGHYYQNMGVLYTSAQSKKTIFSGDAIFPRSELAKYWIPFMINPDLFCESLDKLCALKDLNCCVPGHGEIIYDNLLETSELNKIAIYSTKHSILEVLKQGKLSTEQIIKKVADQNQIQMRLGQFALIGSTIKSYLAVMHDNGEIKLKMENNELFWFL